MLSRILSVVLWLGVSAWAATGHAQDAYPSRPIKLVVPFTPGGSTDVMARLLAKPLGERLKTAIVVDNKPGAGTVLGAEYVAKSAPDGYTLLLSSATTFTVNSVVFRKLPYDPQATFDPLGMVGSTGLVILVHPDAKARTLRELVTESRTNPKLANYGSFGTGSTSHFVGEMLNAATGMKNLHVPYKGSAPAMSDLIGGQIGLTVDTVVAAAPQVRAGKVRALAVASPERSALLPQVATTAEMGYPAVQLTTWFAIVAPRGLPDKVRASLEEAIAGAMRDPATRSALASNGYESDYGAPAEYRDKVAHETERLRRIAQDAGIRAE